MLKELYFGNYFIHRRWCPKGLLDAMDRRIYLVFAPKSTVNSVRGLPPKVCFCRAYTRLSFKTVNSQSIVNWDPPPNPCYMYPRYMSIQRVVIIRRPTQSACSATSNDDKIDLGMLLSRELSTHSRLMKSRVFEFVHLYSAGPSTPPSID